MDLLDFPSIIFYQIPMSTYTLRQASRRSWRIPQKKPVDVYYMTYLGTMQIRLMQLMAQKLISSLAIEGELTDKGLAALSESSDSMAIELAKMLVEKGESSENQNLKDIWAEYRRKDVQVEVKISRGITDLEPEPETIPKEENVQAKPDTNKGSTEVEMIGDKLVKIEFTEYVGERKKKVTRIEVTQAELDKMMKDSDRQVQVQYTLF